MDKLWYIHIVGYHSIVKKNKFLIHATTRVTLKIIMLTERSPIKMSTSYLVLFIHVTEGAVRATEGSGCLCVCGMGVKRGEKGNKGALGNFEGWWVYVHCLHCGSIHMSTLIQSYTSIICSLL